MNSDKIGKFIYELRTKQGYSQYQLADKIPISRQAVSKWERGETIPDSSTLIRLSDIFKVTINELLKGERIKKPSIEELQKTTLQIVDDHNRQRKEIKQLLCISTAIILSLIFIFLFYYFLNFYNQIKVYRIASSNEIFPVTDGIMIITNQKSYLKIGTIHNPNNLTIHKLKLICKNQMMYEGEDMNIILQNEASYDEYKLKDLIENSILEVYYGENQIERILLSFQRDFTNNTLLFHNKKKITSNYSLKNRKQDSDIKDFIKKITKEGNHQKNVYQYKEYYYYEDQQLLIKKNNNKVEWTYDSYNNQYMCPTNDCEKRMKEEIQEECN